MKCSNCGYENKDTSWYCENCGSLLLADDLKDNTIDSEEYKEIGSSEYLYSSHNDDSYDYSDDYAENVDAQESEVQEYYSDESKYSDEKIPEDDKKIGILVIILAIIGLRLPIFFLIAFAIGLYGYFKIPAKKHSFTIIGLIIAGMGMTYIGIFGSYTNSLSSLNESHLTSANEIEQDTSIELAQQPAYELTPTADCKITNMSFNFSGQYKHYTLKVYVEILNTGKHNIYAVGPTFDIEDEEGHLITKESYISACPGVILPGEKGYLYNDLPIVIPDDVDPSAVLLKPHFTVKHTDAEIVDYEVTDTSVKKGVYGITECVGWIYNHNSFPIIKSVNVVFFDKDYNCIDITNTELLNIPANGQTSFKITELGIDYDSIAHYRVIARDDNMSVSNLLT